MKIKKIFILLFILLVLVGLSLNYFIFSIYDVTIVVKPTEVFADPTKEIIVTAKPVNAMGRNAPFRKVKSKFKIMEGDNLVTIKLINEENGYIILQPIGMEGKIGIYIDSDYSLFPSYVEAYIFPKIV